MFHSVGLWWFGDTFHNVGLWWFSDACFTVWISGGLVTHVSQCGTVVDL